MPYCNECSQVYKLKPSPSGGPPKRTGKCPECNRAYEREKSRRRRDQYATRVRDSVSWQHARALARRRDGGCVLRTQGDCSGQLGVHHIVPLAEGGDNSLSNLMSLCRRHHETLEAEARSFRVAAPTHLPGFRETHKKVTEGPSVG
jgi:5-methylcytosine-specific restriction endonuclease McrA